MTFTWFQVGLIGGLAGFLVWKHVQRERLRRVERAQSMTGRGFETAEIKARLATQRRGAAAAIIRSKSRSGAPEEFARTVRKSLRELSFFRTLESRGLAQAEPRPAHH